MDLWPDAGLLSLKLMQEKNNRSVGWLKINTSCYAYSLHVHSWAQAACGTPKHFISQTKAWPRHTIDPFSPYAGFLPMENKAERMQGCVPGC